jgi:class 3 adenylate cyclase
MDDMLTGTVALLFTDIEGSTRLLHSLGDDYAALLREHNSLLLEAIEAHHGKVVDSQGDSFFAVFPRVKDAAAAAEEGQRRLSAHEWPRGAQVKVRMGIHAAEPELAGGRYVGLGVHRAARVGAAAHGGQVLLSNEAATVLGDSRLVLRDLGAHALKDFERPERLHQLVVDGLPRRFPAPRTGTAKPRWRLLLALCALPLVATAITLPLVLGGGSRTVKVGPTSLAVIDPKTNKVVGEIDLHAKASLIAAGEGYVWLADRDTSTLFKIDPRTRAVIRRTAIDPNGIPTGIAAGEGGVWVGVARRTSLALLEFDPALGGLRRTIALATARPGETGGGFDPYSEPVNVALSGGSVWTSIPRGGCSCESTRRPEPGSPSGRPRRSPSRWPWERPAPGLRAPTR